MEKTYGTPMSVALITGSCGLIGSETCKRLHAEGYSIVGVDNDMRRYFFGDEASTSKTQASLSALHRYTHEAVDIRNWAAVEALFRKHGSAIEVVVHTAAQPSHDWAAKEPLTDFGVNALGTMHLLEATRLYAPGSTFIFTSTNKVYGDTPNQLPLVETETRWELDTSHAWHARGIDESMSIDHCKHSVFGASKVAADVMVQEYGRYFGMKTACFRGGCLTGPAHAGAELHGFLAYLMKCTVTGRPYSVFGYKGKQVRDNIHSHDLVEAFWQFIRHPRSGEVYNLGGSRHSNCSMLEAIRLCEDISGRQLNWSYKEDNRIGDHIWWISDVSKFQQHYPHWKYRYDLRGTLEEIHAACVAS
jgi:CDP-paratose 2-epimerase